ncbi:MAG: hypothetical protein ACD_61C00044G0006 [uncultured bacterium]|nr:MAG: hypothetical protein ACD_61C00044G0006 [uncultured bacterium]
MSSLHSKIWYFIHFTINPKVFFLKKINQTLPGWLLCVYSNIDGKVVFGLTPTWGPLLVGDEMGINDPIISIDNINDACYGFNGGLSDSDVKKILPNDLREWKKIWDKAVETHRIILSKGKNEDRCPGCTDRYFGTGLSKEGYLCPKCFGLGGIYTYGPQKEIGERLLQGSDIKVVDRQATIKFQPSGLLALIDLYRTYHTGIVTDIAQEYLVKHFHSVLNEVFPEVVIYKTEDNQEENGWSAYFLDQNGDTRIRHFYLLRNGHFINLLSGKAETPSHVPQPALKEDFPDRDRWNLSIDILANLCKLAK